MVRKMRGGSPSLSPLPATEGQWRLTDVSLPPPPQHAHRDLWDVDSQALADSDPQMLALAVRALSISGLPKGV